MIGKLTRFQRDTLKEVGSIGASSASTALSKLTGELILVDMTKLEVLSLDNIPDLLGDPKEDVVGIIFTIGGELEGSMACLCKQKLARAIADMVRKQKVGTTEKMDDYTEDLIKEVGNILVGAYITALSNLSKMSMVESTPNFMVGKTEGILKRAIKRVADDLNEIIVIETTLTIQKRRFKQDMVLMLRPKTLDLLFDKLFKELK